MKRAERRLRQPPQDWDKVQLGGQKEDKQFKKDVLQLLLTILKEQRLNYINIVHKENQIMATMDEVLAEVSAETDAGRAVVTLLDGIAANLADVKAQLEAAGADPAKLDEVIQKLRANKDIYAEAVTRHTVAEDPSGDGAHVPGM